MKFVSESREEFAARRRKAQDDAVEEIKALVRDAITRTRWSADLTAAVKDLFQEVYEEESGEKIRRTDHRIKRLLAALRKWFNANVVATSDSTTTALAIATNVINEAASAAIQDDPEELAKEWVTMHDSDVRAAHKDVDGQKRLVGDKFDVAGVEMTMPGDVTAPIELWINCRCSLRPTLISEDFQSTEGGAMTQFYTGDTTGVTNTTMTITLQPGDYLMGRPAEEPEDETVGAGLIPWHGVLAPEGVFSGDGRMFAHDALTFRDLPLPLTYQKSSDDGHKGSVTVGSIEHIERRDAMMHASGYFLATPEADEVVGLLAHFGRYGVSVDADDAEMELDEENGKVTFSKARIAAASVVGIPAFDQAYICLGEPAGSMAASAVVAGRGPGWLTHPVETKRLHDYWTRPGEAGYLKIGWGRPGGGDFYRCRTEVGEEIGENSPEKLRFINQICAQWHHDVLHVWPGQEGVASGETVEMDNAEPAPALTLVASADQIKAPADWFKNPEFTKITHLTVTKEGRVFGHIAEWGVCHIGINGVCTEPPHSNSDYGYFANKAVLLDDGTLARTGVLTLGGKHATGHLSLGEATRHYDTTSAALADVTVGEDDFGIWCAGWLRPGVAPENVVALRASDISGDWREISRGSGELEMVAALAVNAGGFPIKVAASGGRMVSLVAAGMVHDENSNTIDYALMAEALAAAMEDRQKRRERMAALAAKFQSTEGGQ